MCCFTAAFAGGKSNFFRPDNLPKSGLFLARFRVSSSGFLVINNPPKFVKKRSCSYAPQTRNPKPYTLHPTPYTLHSKPQKLPWLNPCIFNGCFITFHWQILVQFLPSVNLAVAFQHCPYSNITLVNFPGKPDRPLIIDRPKSYFKTAAIRPNAYSAFLSTYKTER